MDFSPLDIEKFSRFKVKPTGQNIATIVISFATLIAIFVISLWMPLGGRVVLFGMLLCILIMLLFRDYLITILFGVFLFTIRDVRFLVLGKYYRGFTIFVLVMFIILIIQLKIHGKLEWPDTKLNKFIYLFWATIAVGVANSIFYIGNLPSNAIYEPFVYIIPPLMFFIIVTTVKNKKDFYALVAVISAIICVEFLLASKDFLLSIASGGFDSGIDIRVRGTFGNPNVLSGWLEVVMPLIVAFLISSKTFKERTVFTILVIAGYTAILFTLSRGGFVTSFGTLAIFLLFKVRNKVLSTVIVSSFVVVLLALSSQLARTFSVFDYSMLVRDPSTLHRLVQYVNYSYVIAKYPILGIGWGAKMLTYNFGQFVVSHHPEEYYGHLNSTFFDFGVHNGFIGIIVVYTLLGAIVFHLLKNARTIKHRRLSLISWGVAWGVISFIVHSFIDGYLKFEIFSINLWFTVGLGFCAKLLWDKYGEDFDKQDIYKFKINLPFINKKQPETTE